MKTITVLRKAKRLIEKGWTKRAWARNSHGRAVDAHSRSAVRFCALGAIRLASKGVTADRVGARDALHSVLEFTSNIENFNDDPGTKKSDVIRLFNRAIAAERK